MAGYNEVHKYETVEWNGHMLKLSRPSFATEGAFAKIIANRAIRAIHGSRQVLGEEGFQESLKAWQRDNASGEYDWGSKTVEASIWNMSTLPELIFLIVTQHDDATVTTRSEFDAAWEEKRDELVSAFFAVMAPTDPTNPLPSQPEAAAEKS